ncbi:MAG: hypothetical protein IJX21_07645, partial [Alistipes sp.]|nr:hypothetical protein [Alistipes sp.]
EPEPEPDLPGGGIEPDQPTMAYTKIDDITLLQAGTYYIGGYLNGTLYLAISETPNITTGHMHTASFTYNDADGSLSPTTDAEAIAIRLEPAANAHTYYLYFTDNGYLTATGNDAGKLDYTNSPQSTWTFRQAEGGFEVQQTGDIPAKLIISRRAPNRLLRSIADDEDDGNPIVLFRKN